MLMANVLDKEGPVDLIRADESVVAAAQRTAIDAVYYARDNGGTMHDAGRAAADAALAAVIEWLHTPDALWPIEKARRDGVPEFAADNLADVLAWMLEADRVEAA